MNNKVKINYKEIIKFLKTPKGKTVLFFGFYFIFFTVLFILSRFGNYSTTSSNISDDLPFSLSKIEKDNYHFKYSYNLDDVVNVYEGDRNNNKELFLYNDINYYRNESSFLANNSNVWVKCDSPYKMDEFINVGMIREILNKATYVSKTDYDSGMNVYTYQISTSTLVKLFTNLNIDLDDKPNEIIVKTDSSNNLNVIKYDLTSYALYNKLANVKSNLELNYSKFGKIKDIDISQ